MCVDKRIFIIYYRIRRCNCGNCRGVCAG